MLEVGTMIEPFSKLKVQKDARTKNVSECNVLILMINALIAMNRSLRISKLAITFFRVVILFFVICIVITIILDQTEFAPKPLGVFNNIQQPQHSMMTSPHSPRSVLNTENDEDEGDEEEGEQEENENEDELIYVAKSYDMDSLIPLETSRLFQLSNPSKSLYYDYISWPCKLNESEKMEYGQFSLFKNIKCRSSVYNVKYLGLEKDQYSLCGSQRILAEDVEKLIALIENHFLFEMWLDKLPIFGEIGFKTKDNKYYLYTHKTFVQNDCNKPRITFEFENVDIDRASEHLTVRVNDTFFADCGDGGNLNQYDDEGIAQYDAINIGQTLMISIFVSNIIDALCETPDHDQYSFNAQLKLRCKQFGDNADAVTVNDDQYTTRDIFSFGNTLSVIIWVIILLFLCITFCLIMFCWKMSRRKRVNANNELADNESMFDHWMRTKI